MVKKAVCLISGGIDSCVTAYLAKNEGYEIHGLSFNYGQRHMKELASARAISSAVHAIDHIIFAIDLKKFGGSSLVDRSIVTPLDHTLEDIGKSIPTTYVPARNTVFLSIALAYAEVLDADAIFIGVTATDYAGYPDCRPQYIEAFQKMADLATKRGVEGKSIKINTPLLHLSKAAIIKKGLELDAPFEKTWSCYHGGEKACGRCDSCLIRLKGFKEAGTRDPIKYGFLPDWYLK
jgi:7-cyano-7-deazaguanine synthase